MTVDNDPRIDPTYMALLAHKADQAREKIERFQKSDNKKERVWAELAIIFVVNDRELTPKQVATIRKAQLNGLGNNLIEEAIKTGKNLADATKEYRELYPLCPWD